MVLYMFLGHQLHHFLLNGSLVFFFFVFFSFLKRKENKGLKKKKRGKPKVFYVNILLND